MLSERNWRIESVARMVIGFFVTAFCLMVFASTIRQYFTDLSPENRTLFDIIVGAFIFQGMALVWAFNFLREEKLSVRDAFGFRSSTTLRAVLFGIVAGICVVPIAWLLQILSVQVMNALNLTPQSQELVRTFQESTRTTAEPNLLRQQIVFGFSVVFLAPVAEEILFRGIIYPTIKNLGFPRIGLWVSAIVFALLHQNMAGFIPFIFLGIALVLVYEETDNLLAPILAHSVFNTANFAYMIFEKPINRMLFNT